jgi:hypothetical protein
LAGLRAKDTADVMRGLAFHHGALPGKLFNEKAASHEGYLPMKQEEATERFVAKA